MINPRIFLIYNYCNLTPPEDVDGLFIEYSQGSTECKIRPYTVENPLISDSLQLPEKNIDLIKLTGILRILSKYEAKVVEENGMFKLYSMDHREIKSLRVCMPICELQIDFIDNTEDYNFEEFCKEALISKWRVI